MVRGSMIVEHVSDPGDARLEPFRSVRDRDAVGADGRPGLFIGESPLVIDAMLRSSTETLSLLASERQRDRAVELVERARGERDHDGVIAGQDDVDPDDLCKRKPEGRGGEFAQERSPIRGSPCDARAGRG
jgi:hypothetical protein